MNNRKSPLGSVIIILIVIWGIWWLSTNKTAPTDDVSNLLVNLEQETEIDFSDIQAVELTWMFEADTGVEEMTIQGKGFEVDGISNDQQNLITAFFETQGFEVDMYNVTAGTIVGLAGYKKDDIVCIYEGGVSGGAAGMDADPVIYYAKINCGQAIIPVMKTNEELIAEAFAIKYDKPIDEIAISISERIKVFASGGVTFSPGGSENSGIWLAVKEDNVWKILFDGNGAIMCIDIEPYDFPVEIASQCVDEQGNLKQR